MKLYIAGDNGYAKGEENINQLNNENKLKRINILESFFYIQEWQKPLIKQCKSFMLDSGAFTFMVKPNVKLDWDSYIERYADFINENDVKLFFELDIDSIVGYEQVKVYRKKLESLTGKQCIPVWHRTRGKDNFVQMCKDYNYVAIGGIVSGEIKQDEYKVFNALCDIAHNENSKIHGLGFTKSGLDKYKFDSVDSTAWLYGNRGGFLYKFNGVSIGKIHAPEGSRLKSKEVAIHNFWEWVKYGEYLEMNACLAGTGSRPYIIGGGKSSFSSNEKRSTGVYLAGYNYKKDILL